MAVVITPHDAVGNASNSNDYEFQDRGVGTPAADRWVIVAVATADAPVDFVEINGDEATPLVIEGDSDSISLWGRLVPTGTTVDIYFETDGFAQRAAIAVWTVTGAGTTVAAFDSDGGTSSLSLAVPANGGVIAAAYIVGATTATWTGVTERFEETVESSRALTGGDALTASASGAFGITVSGGDERISAAFSIAPEAGGVAPHMMHYRRLRI